MPGKWWETEENIVTFRDKLEKWRNGQLEMIGGSNREIPNFGEFVNPPEQINLNNQFIYYRGGNDRENSDREAEQGNIPRGGEQYPFINDFIESILKQHEFTDELQSIFDDIIPISTVEW